MKISLIVAMAANRAIGLDGRMPWHLSADLKHFRNVTMGSPVLMGRKTFEAIGRPLPGRNNLIITGNSAYQAPGCQVFNSIDSALSQAGDCSELFVIGGATLYQALLAQADYLYLTEIDKEFPGDTFFPAIEPNHWREVWRREVVDDISVDFRYRFLKLERHVRPYACAPS